jgi:hypothetical protein
MKNVLKRPVRIRDREAFRSHQGRRGDRSLSRRILNQEKKTEKRDVTGSTQGPELGLGPLSTRIKRMEMIWPQNLASLRVFRGQREFSATGAAAQPHTKDTKVTEATSLCFADAFFLGNPFPGFETRSSPDSLGALPIAPLPSISEIPVLDFCVPAFLIKISR